MFDAYNPETGIFAPYYRGEGLYVLQHTTTGEIHCVGGLPAHFSTLNTALDHMGFIYKGGDQS